MDKKVVKKVVKKRPAETEAESREELDDKEHFSLDNIYGDSCAKV